MGSAASRNMGNGDRAKKEDMTKVLNEAIDRIKKIPGFRKEDGNWNEDLLRSLDDFCNINSFIANMGSLPYDVVQKYACEAGQRLSESKSTSIVCQVIMDSWQRGYKNENGEIDTDEYEGISKSLDTLVYFSDSTPEITYDIIAEPNFLETINIILTTLLAARLGGKEERHDDSVVDCCLLIYQNTSKVSRNISHLRSLKIVPIFNVFLHTKTKINRVYALSTLANIIDEKDSVILQNKHEVVADLLNILDLAVKDKDHRNSGYSAEECAMTVRKLARNDKNKKLLVQMDCLPHLVELAKCGNVQEQREAVGAIWILTFDETNRSKIMIDQELNIIDFLIEFKTKSFDKEVRNAVDGTLWNFREELQNNEKYKHIVSFFEEKNRSATMAKQSKESPGTAVEDKKGHIMISYDWSHQGEVLKIRNVLIEYGYEVWMDIEKMSGSLLQAMADAVEHAHVVLICASQNYKDSPNCRAEAEYAFQLKKNIVPLKMERGYIPDGWLGILVRTKLFFEFSGKYTFESKIKELIHEIADCYGTPNDVPVKRREVSMVTVAAIQKWTPADVNKWIEKHSLPKKYSGKLTSGELALLVTMRSEASDIFYNCLQKNLGISNLQNMAMFIKGLEDFSI